MKRKAFLVGLNDYENGIPKLRSAADDASELAEILESKFGYECHLCEDGSKAGLKAFLKELGATKAEDKETEQLLFYFAGHGLAQDSDDGTLCGYLIPTDANPTDFTTFVAMGELHQALESRAPHHTLVILDCCFAGALRWAGGHRDFVMLKEVTKEQFDYYQKGRVCQALTSSAHDELAVDVLRGGAVRGESDRDRKHSPFAERLLEALKSGAADIVPPGGDGIITATELYLFLLSQFRELKLGQTPGLWPLKSHEKGEFLFLLGEEDKVRSKLNSAVTPNFDDPEAILPYRGLEPYRPMDSDFFFGRTVPVEELQGLILNHRAVVVTGASGTGKSSLVKAGLIPSLCHRSLEAGEKRWQLLGVMSPGPNPQVSLHTMLNGESGQASVEYSGELPSVEAQFEEIRERCKSSPGQKFLWAIDQLEELFTLGARNEDKASQVEFETRLASLIDDESVDNLKIVMTLRPDFEPRFEESPLQSVLPKVASSNGPDDNSVSPQLVSRYVPKRMTQDDYRQVIVEPAAHWSLFFDPPELVEKLINEVVEAPGALPLLSFTLRNLAEKALTRDTKKRRILESDFHGVSDSVKSAAERVYESMSADHQLALRGIILRMVSITGTERTKRRVYVDELTFGKPNEPSQLIVNEVLAALLKQRLVTTGRDTLGSYWEPAHDYLISGWDRLNKWVEDFDDFALFRRLSEDALQWKRSGEKGPLWDRRPAELKLAHKWLPPEEGWCWGFRGWLRNLFQRKN